MYKNTFLVLEDFFDVYAETTTINLLKIYYNRVFKQLLIQFDHKIL